jgi:hypothetical protein
MSPIKTSFLLGIDNLADDRRDFGQFLLIRLIGNTQGEPAEALTLRIDAVLVGLMACLALLIFMDSLIKWYRLLFSHSFKKP